MSLISIVMPAYNAADFIELSIKSAQAQTYKEWELIVVDDGSTDDTAAITKRLMRTDHRIKYIYQHNQKLGAARNTGLSAATGEWIAFLDSDDLWHETKLDMQLKAAEKYEADIVFSNGEFLINETNELKTYPTITGRYQGAEMYKMLCLQNVVPVLAVIVKKKVVDVIGLQDVDVRAYGCEDWDYWLRIAKAGFVFFSLQEKLFLYRIHRNAMSQNLVRMKSSEFYVIYKNLERSNFNGNEYGIIKAKLINLLKFIIPAYFAPENKEVLSYYLSILRQLEPRSGTKIAYALHSIASQKTSSAILQLINKQPQQIIFKKILGLKNKMLGINSKQNGQLRKHARIIKTAFSEFNNRAAIEQPFSVHVFSDNYELNIGKNVSFRAFCHVLVHPGSKLTIKDDVFFNSYCSINCLSSVEIGENTLIGEGVKIYDHNHKFGFKDQKLQVEREVFTTSPVKIGSNCWIGSNVVILKGVTIGNNVIIGAGNVIYSSVPDNTILKLKTESIQETHGG